jgi:putative heme iron utilization protein
MPYALDSAGRPLFLISTMAMHTQNMEADPRSSLLVTQPDWSGDPLASGRLTLMGAAVKLPSAEAVDAREGYLARHPRASYWIDFDDFAFWRLDIVDVYFVGGFAAMDWVKAADYSTAQADPLADVAPEIIEHMNRDHVDALIAYALYYTGDAADEVAMVTIDRLGFKLRLRRGERLWTVRIAFPCEVETAARSREVLIGMLRTARGG